MQVSVVEGHVLICRFCFWAHAHVHREEVHILALMVPRKRPVHPLKVVHVDCSSILEGFHQGQEVATEHATVDVLDEVASDGVVKVGVFAPFGEFFLVDCFDRFSVFFGGDLPFRGIHGSDGVELFREHGGLLRHVG